MWHPPTRRAVGAVHTDESGVALLFVIVFMIVVAGVAVLLQIASNDARTESRQRVERVLNLPPVHGAITRWQYALQTDKSSDRNMFVMDQKTLLELRNDPTTDTVISNTSLQLPEPYRIQPTDVHSGIFKYNDTTKQLDRLQALPVTARYAVQEKLQIGTGTAACTSIGLPAAQCTGGSAISGFWQLMRVDVPDYAAKYQNGNLVGYFRVWVGANSGSWYTPASIVRVAMRPGSFADYEIMADGPVHFEDDATVDGPVHSNGYDVDLFGASSPYSGSDKIWTGGTKADGINCTANTAFSTAKGTITVKTRSTSPKPCSSQDENNHHRINFLRVEDSYTRIAYDADVAKISGVHHYKQHHDGDYSFYVVSLNGNTITIDKPWTDCWQWDFSCYGGTTTVKVTDRTALLFDDDVVISGGTGKVDGRVTIAAHYTSAVSGAANIYIERNIGPQDDTDPAQVLGLIAQGNVIAQQMWNFSNTTSSTPNPCSVSYVHAAMIAATGALTIPPEVLTDTEQTTSPLCSGKFRMVGSIAGHRSPTMHWQWDSGKETGYTKRSYSWDSNLHNNPPPYFPLTDGWNVSDIKEDADLDCVLGSRYQDPGCS